MVLKSLCFRVTFANWVVVIICFGMSVEVQRVCNGIEIDLFFYICANWVVVIICLGMPVEVHGVCNGIEIAPITILFRTFCLALTHAVRVKMFRNRIEICVSWGLPLFILVELIWTLCYGGSGIQCTCTKPIPPSPPQTPPNVRGLAAAPCRSLLVLY